MLTDHEIAQLMNSHSLQGGNNDSPWWLTFARAVERAAVAAERERCFNLVMDAPFIYVLDTDEDGTFDAMKAMAVSVGAKIRAAAPEVPR